MAGRNVSHRAACDLTRASQGRASLGRRVILIEEELHLPEQAHAVLFHDQRVGAFANFNIALVGRAG